MKSFQKKIVDITRKALGMDNNYMKINYRKKPSINTMMKYISEYRDVITNPVYSLEKAPPMLFQNLQIFSNVAKVNYEKAEKMSDIWYNMKVFPQQIKIRFSSKDIYPERAISMRKMAQKINQKENYEYIIPNPGSRVKFNFQRQDRVINIPRYDGESIIRGKRPSQPLNYHTFLNKGSSIPSVNQGYEYFGDIGMEARAAAFDQWKRLPSIVSKKENTFLMDQVSRLAKFRG